MVIYLQINYLKLNFNFQVLVNSILFLKPFVILFSKLNLLLFYHELLFMKLNLIIISSFIQYLLLISDHHSLILFVVRFCLKILKYLSLFMFQILKYSSLTISCISKLIKSYLILGFLMIMIELFLMEQASLIFISILILNQKFELLLSIQ